MSRSNRTIKKASRNPQKFHVATQLSLVVLLAAGAWLMPAHAQEHSAPAANMAPGGAPAGGETGATGAPSQAGGEHTAEGTPHEAGAAHGEGAGHEAKGGHGEEESEGVSIHLPTWIYTPLKNFWYAGPATLSADGAVTAAGQSLDGKALAGKKVDYTYHDHHSLIKPKPTYAIHPVIGAIGNQTPNAGSKTDTVTIDGAEVTLVNPTVNFAYAGMFPELWVISMLTLLGIMLATFLMTRKLERVPDRKQTLLEIIYTYFDGFVHGLIGDHYKRYLPLVGTIYVYVLMMNLAGIIPGWASPTANINVPAGIAIVVVLYVQFEGIRVNGLKGYLMHFVGDPWWLGPLNFPIHAVGEVARVLSLTIRLFGNIFGEDVVIVILIFLAGMFTKGFFPVQAPMYLLAIFTSFVQAMVFSILTSVYIALMTTHEGEGHGHGHDEEHGVYHDGHAPAPAV